MEFWRFTSENLTAAKQTKQGWLKTDPSLLTQWFLSPLHVCVCICVWLPLSSHAWIRLIISPSTVFSASHRRFLQESPIRSERRFSFEIERGLAMRVGVCSVRLRAGDKNRRRRPGRALPCLWVHSLPDQLTPHALSFPSQLAFFIYKLGFLFFSFTSHILLLRYTNPFSGPRSSLRHSPCLLPQEEPSLIWDTLDLVSLKAI